MPPVAFLELETTTAGAGLIAANLGERLCPDSLFLSQELHYLRGREPPAKQLGHDLQRFVDMLKECFVAGAQVVQSRLAIRGS